ncbi:MAG: hypothetical protein COA78_31020, partial [Blastopirellula sp.]
MKIDDHIIDLLIQWEDRQRSGQPISVQELANGNAKVEQQLETLIPRMSITDWVHIKPNPNSTGLDLPSKKILKQSLIMPNDLTLERFLSNLKKAELCDPQELQQFIKKHATSNVHQLVNALVEAELLTPFQARAVAHGKIKGLTLGNYLILDKIGEGGMGAVYKAKHKRLDRIVALKVLPRESKKNQTVIARFLQEAQTAAKLSHPNIVATHDSDEAHGYQFLVMEYIDGKDLSITIKRNGALSVIKAVDYLIQVARGLEYAHGEGIIHRDIKPHNLLVDKNELVKILDMGLARVEARDEDHDDLTQEGAIMGTVDYMPPEQAIDTKSVDRRGDLYSLGSTLHFLLTGKPPFKGDSLLVKMLAHREQAPPDLTQVRKDVHPQLNFVFQKLMAKLPDARYQSAGELIATLQALRPEIESYEKNIGTAPPPLPQIHTESNTSLSQLSQISASIVQSLSLDSLFKSKHLRKLAALPKHLKIAGAVAAVVTLCLSVYLLASLMSGSSDVVIDDPVEPVVEVPKQPDTTPATEQFVEQAPISTNAKRPASLFAADIDGDGDMDVVGSSTTDNKIAWYENDGKQNFTEHIISNNGYWSRSLFVADVDRDGTLDVLSGSNAMGRIVWYKNDGKQNFTEQYFGSTASGIDSIFGADLDNDGDLDVLSSSFLDSMIAWYENDGKQNFTEHIISTNASAKQRLLAADVDSDGDLDVLSASVRGSKIIWHENDGKQNFTEHIISNNVLSAHCVIAADVDGDGDLDTLSASLHDDKIAWFENDGKQNFTEHIITKTADGANHVLAVDVDGDGDMDAISASLYDNKIAWHENNGKQHFTQHFTQHIISTSAEGHSKISMADLDGDGDMDLLCVFPEDDKIIWYKNISTPSTDNTTPPVKTNNPAPAITPIVVTPTSNPPVAPKPNTKDAFISMPGFPMVVLKAGTENYVPNLLESAVDQQGNIFLLCAQPIDRDFNPSIPNQEFVPVRSISYLTKLDPTGNQLWSRKIEASSSKDLAVDQLGNCYVTGVFRNFTKVVNAPASTQLNTTPKTIRNVNVFCFDSNGSVKWSKSYGGENSLSVDKITTSPTGEIYLTGRSSGTAILTEGAQNFNLNRKGGYIIQLSNQGTIHWVKQFLNLEFSFSDIKTSADGSIYLLGTAHHKTDLDPGFNEVWLEPQDGQSNAFLLSLDSLGNYRWSQVISNESSTNYDITVDYQNNVYVTGSFAAGTRRFPLEDVDGGYGDCGFDGDSDDGFRRSLLAFDPQGVYRWSHDIGNNQPVTNPQLATDEQGNLHLVYTFKGTITFNPNQGGKTFTSTGPNSDIALIKYDTNGKLLSEQTMGYQSHDSSESIHVDSSGNTIIIGSILGLTDDAPLVVDVKQIDWRYIHGIYLNKLAPKTAGGSSTPMSSLSPSELADAIAEIKKLGGKVSLYKSGGMRVIFNRTQITNEGLVHLKGLTSLTEL